MDQLNNAKAAPAVIPRHSSGTSKIATTVGT